MPLMNLQVLAKKPVKRRTFFGVSGVRFYLLGVLNQEFENRTVPQQFFAFECLLRFRQCLMLITLCYIRNLRQFFDATVPWYSRYPPEPKMLIISLVSHILKWLLFYSHKQIDWNWCTRKAHFPLFSFVELLIIATIATVWKTHS